MFLLSDTCMFGLGALKDDMYIVNGGPTLLADGKNSEKVWAVQGWVPIAKNEGTESLDIRDEATLTNKVKRSNRSKFYESWINQRHPRTAPGVTGNGVLVIAVIYGRNPKVSAGASIPEMADVMQSLGAIDAVNLDGGGSSAMYVRGKVTGIPSDESGEREVADALILVLGNKE